MANLKKLSDQELDVSALVSAKNERLALAVVLEHLAEVGSRKSFSPRFESLEAYAIGHLGYDSKSAWRRVSALRLMQEVPEITPAIESGKLDLTKIVLAQNHFRNEARVALRPSVTEETISFLPVEVVEPKPLLTKSEKIDVLNCVMSQTSREAQRSLISKSSAPEKLKRPDLVRSLAGQSNEVRLVLSDEDLALVRDLKGLLAHKIPNASVSQVVSSALKEAVAAIKRERSGENKKRRAAREHVRSGERPKEELLVSAAPANTVALAKAAKAERTRRAGAALKRKVWNRGEGKCEICGSCFALEYDHRVPFAHGGKTTFENLRLICRNCNQREAIKIFGPRANRRREESKIGRGETDAVRCREARYNSNAGHKPDRPTTEVAV